MATESPGAMVFARVSLKESTWWRATRRLRAKGQSSMIAMKFGRCVRSHPWLRDSAFYFHHSKRGMRIALPLSTASPKHRPNGLARFSRAVAGRSSCRSMIVRDGGCPSRGTIWAVRKMVTSSWPFLWRLARALGVRATELAMKTLDASPKGWAGPATPKRTFARFRGTTNCVFVLTTASKPRWPRSPTP